MKLVRGIVRSEDTDPYDAIVDNILQQMISKIFNSIPNKIHVSIPDWELGILEDDYF